MQLAQAISLNLKIIAKTRFSGGHTNFSTSRGIVGGFVKTQLGWSYGRPPVWIWKMPIFRYLIFWNVISRSLGQSLSLVFLPVGIGRNPDSTEFTRPLSGSVRLINRHCPRTVTSATSNGSLSLVLSYIRPQIVLLLQDGKSDVWCIHPLDCVW